MTFRNLTENEIEARVAQVYQGKGITLLLYKNARCDMNILDETVGAENWQRKHYECKGNLYCSVGIKVGCVPDMNGVLQSIWVWKDDCGSESYTEKEKGEASDSFKRACVNWGIGRELYTAPLIYVTLNDRNGKPNYDIDDKNRVKGTFVVTYVKIVDGVIKGLNIENTRKNKTVFAWGDLNG